MKDVREMRHIAPSSHNPWEAFVEGGMNDLQRRKAGAMAAKIVRNRHRDALPVNYTVKLPLEQTSVEQLPRLASIVCPVIAARKDRTRLLVIAPDGSDQWVDWK